MSRKRKKELPPLLHVVAMYEDQNTSDDKIGSFKFNLENLIVLNELEPCGVTTLDFERVNLFDLSAITLIRSKDAFFPREITGYWPLCKKKLLNRELKSTCSVCLTIQLLNASEAAKYPADSGNIDGPGNRFPTLIRPIREHGRLRDKLLYNQIEHLKGIVDYVTGIPSLRLFIVFVVLVVFLFLKVKITDVVRAVVAVFKVVHGFGVEHPILLRSVVMCRGITFIVWIFKMWEIFIPTKIDDIEGSHPERSHSVTRSSVKTQQAILQSARSKQVPAAGEKVKADQNSNLKRKTGRGQAEGTLDAAQSSRDAHYDKAIFGFVDTLLFLLRAVVPVVLFIYVLAVLHA